MMCFFDMDGVITDFDKAFRKISGGIDVDKYKETRGKESGFKLVLKQGKDFWTDLEWIDGGKEILDFAVKHYEIVRVLSSAGTGRDWASFKNVRDGKIEWAAKNMPQIKKKDIIIVPFSSMKSKFATPSSIIVDDKEKTIREWVGKNGIGILHHHSNWKNTLDKLQSYSFKQ